MAYPIPLKRYETIRVKAMQLDGNWPADKVAEGDPSRWEIIGVSGSGENAVLVIGKVRAGVRIVTHIGT